jgi:acyl-[acyl-carrier-protein]-phospholipid O-acyltransferase/long-chain-fatty-acid--[acyl-carrier-protein] ligase
MLKPQQSTRLGLIAYYAASFSSAMLDNFFKFILSLLVVVPTVANPNSHDHFLPIVGAAVVVPYLLLSGTGGMLADRFRKRDVLLLAKIGELLTAGLSCALFLLPVTTPQLWALIAVLGLTACLSALASPSKYGILPELVPAENLPTANGYLEASTFLGIIAGTALAGILYELWGHSLARLGWVMLGIVLCGIAAAWATPRTPHVGEASGKQNSWRSLLTAIAMIRKTPQLRLAAGLIAWFWFFGALVQLALVMVGEQELGLPADQTGWLAASAGIGIVVGSVLAGKLSGHQAKLSYLYYAGVGMGAASVALFLASNFLFAAIAMVVLGISAAFYSVPIYSFFLAHCPDDNRGKILAGLTFINTLGILLASVTLFIGHNLLGLAGRQLILIAGIGTIALVVARLQKLRANPSRYR